MSVSIDFSGKIVLITGASSGIGPEIARVFHRAGASVGSNHPGFGDTASDADAGLGACGKTLKRKIFGLLDWKTAALPELFFNRPFGLRPFCPLASLRFSQVAGRLPSFTAPRHRTK